MSLPWGAAHRGARTGAMLAQRTKMVRIGVQAKNRLQSLLHRHHFLPPENGDIYDPELANWWLLLPVTPLEKLRIQSDLATLAFSKQQSGLLTQAIAERAAQEDRVPLLVQLPGISVIGAMTLRAAIGDISRFPAARQLVGYAGLGACVHDSGQTHHTGRITKAGRRDGAIMVEAANHAARTHPHWRAELKRLEPRGPQQGDCRHRPQTARASGTC